MAVSVDKVYQKVLALANKEQRGYVTPQEFNLFADHAQMDIFEQYFYSLNQKQRMPGNQSEYADIVTNIEEKISMFEVHDQSVGFQDGGFVYISNQFPNFYRLNSVRVSYIKGGNGFNTADEIQLNEVQKYAKSPLGTYTKLKPVYTRLSTVSSQASMRIYPPVAEYTNPVTGNVNSDTVIISYIKRPKAPNWTYVISNNKNALYNPSAADHMDFELHSSEENKLVIKILQLAGISIKDNQLTATATQQEVKNIQLENK